VSPDKLLDGENERGQAFATFVPGHRGIVLARLERLWLGRQGQMNALMVVALVVGTFALGFGVGRKSSGRRGLRRAAGSLTRLPPARPTLYVVAGGRNHRSGVSSNS
jgi:hypothetical protein